ncbi:hypothetical protein KUTeg_004667 [Tegillarca granosa]|uniref:DPH-type MB domain-containing protein n=1 Tax=Tegillarca granosa TaxID=220873 RepID=A0ABQ9FKF8_TEGGR|nr:hypothetical protein KUTeg_004667 [Tegillarca granosa]
MTPKLRKEYDIRWKQRCLAQDWPIQEEVNFSAFELDGHAGNGPCTEDSNMYTYHCRCGGEFSLTKTDVTLKFDIICCNTCSLAVKLDTGQNCFHLQNQYLNHFNCTQDVLLHNFLNK